MLANRTPPTSTSETFSYLPTWEVSLEPGGQSPISQEFHVHPPTIDTLETGITRSVAPNKHLLEGWGQHPTTNSSSPGLGPPSTNQILTEEVFPAQDRHASHRALVQACREIEGGFIPGRRSLGKGGGARFSAKPFCFQK